MAQVLTKIIGFFYTLFLAKSLGVESFGLYTVALAYFSIISSISDFGFNRYLIREVAKNKLKVYELFCNIGMFRLTITSVIFGIFAISLYLFDPDKLRTSLILLAVLAILPQSIALTLDGVFIALQKFQFSVIALLLASLANALIGLFLINKGFGNAGAINALTISQLIYGISLFTILGFSKGLHFSRVELSIIKKALIGGLPYSLLGILGLIYFRIDAILLSYIKGSFETGLYGAAYRVLEVIVFIPSALGTALFPTLSRMHDNKSQKIKEIYFKSVGITAVISILIVLGYLTILPFIIRIFLQDYLKSLEAIRILSLAIPFMFLHMVSASFVLSSERYLRGIILLSIIPVTFNILMNLSFIPIYGFIGASWVTVLSDILSFVLIFIFIKKNILKNG